MGRSMIHQINFVSFHAFLKQPLPRFKLCIKLLQLLLLFVRRILSRLGDKLLQAGLVTQDQANKAEEAKPKAPTKAPERPRDRGHDRAPARSPERSQRARPAAAPAPQRPAKELSPEEQKKRDAERAKDPDPGDPPPSSSGTLFVNPTQTRPIHVTSEYGMRYHPVLHYWRLHAGIDLRDYCGNDVYAARSGTVAWTQYRYGYGNQVMITHGSVNGRSLATSYNHLSSFVVRPGAYVKAGQLIARAGNTGTSGGCHLHFEVYFNGATTNPRPYLPL